MRKLSLIVNEHPVEGSVEARTSLADFLRGELALTGTRLGCEHGVCGTCTVLMDGVPVRSCIILAVACEGRSIRTIEGFDDDPTMSRLRQAFSSEHALQCGFCTAGMLISGRDIVDRLGAPDEARIRKELNGNLCRCTGYLGIVRAIQRVIAESPPPGTGEAGGEFEAAPGRLAKFTPREGARAAPETVGEAPRAGVAPGTAGEAKRGWTRIEQRLHVEHPRPAVWSMLDDLPAVAACLPGAELTAIEDGNVEGKVNLKLGPISASFAGSGTVTRDRAAYSGALRGSGSDSLSGTRVEAEIEYRLEPAAGNGGTEILVSLEFRLLGALAQFSRSGLVTDLANRLAAEFAANLAARMAGGDLAGAAAGQPKLNIGSFLWSVIWSRLKRLFGGGS